MTTGCVSLEACQVFSARACDDKKPVSQLVRCGWGCDSPGIPEEQGISRYQSQQKEVIQSRFSACLLYQERCFPPIAGKLCAEGLFEESNKTLFIATIQERYLLISCPCKLHARWGAVDSPQSRSDRPAGGLRLHAYLSIIPLPETRPSSRIFHNKPTRALDTSIQSWEYESSYSFPSQCFHLKYNCLPRFIRSHIWWHHSHSTWSPPYCSDDVSQLRYSSRIGFLETHTL